MLDYLAAHFQSGSEHGWSVKQTIRSIVLSHAYQVASTYDPADAAADPGDRFLWRMSPAPPGSRVDSRRDACRQRSTGSESSAWLAGDGPAVAEFRKKGNDSAMEDAVSTNRSVYLPIVRELVPPVLDLFDFAEPTLVTGNRDVTTVPTQALFLMNNPFVLDQSRRLADKRAGSLELDDAGRVDMIYRLALSPASTAAETARALQYTASYARDDHASRQREISQRPRIRRLGQPVPGLVLPARNSGISSSECQLHLFAGPALKVAGNRSI